MTTRVRVKTAKGRPLASTRWLDRQLNDPYVQRAKQEGYRARSVYKLQQLDEQLKLIRPGMRLVDLGAAPGSWSQYAARRQARVLALDLLPVDPIAGVEIMQGDFLDPAVQAEVAARLGGPVDLVLSDMAPAATGRRTVDRLRAEGLGEAALAFAADQLRPGGNCLIKLVRGAEAPLQAQAKGLFRATRLLRPDATRSDSSEIFILAQDCAPQGRG